MTADITLPKNWKPIGCTKDGSNDINRGAPPNAFSGTFDGGNHLLTVPAGERPLFAYVNGTALTVTVEKTVAATKIEVFEYLKLKEAAGEESGQSNVAGAGFRKARERQRLCHRRQCDVHLREV